MTNSKPLVVISRALACIFFASFALARPVQRWSKTELEAYDRRNFIELEQLMVESGKSSFLEKVKLQEIDLKGCKALHHGFGGITEMTACMRFVNREFELDLKGRGTVAVINDLSLLCGRLIKTESDVRQLARSRVLIDDRKRWQNCTDRAWRQVYLTAAARFDAEPVPVLSYVRTAESGLPLRCPWADKTLKLVQGSAVVRPLK